jgi:hypothetical protein
MEKNGLYYSHSKCTSLLSVEHNTIRLGEVQCDWNYFYVTPSLNSLLCEGKVTLCRLRTFRNKTIITLCNK